MGRKSLIKGKNFEREVAKVFSKFWDSSVDSVRRVPLSGGFPQKGSWGDLRCVNSQYFPFFISLKKVEGWRLEQVFNLDNCIIFVWYAECRSMFYSFITSKAKEFEVYPLLPLLVCSRNKVVPLVVTRLDDLDILNKLIHIFTVEKLVQFRQVMLIRQHVIVPLKDFCSIFARLNRVYLESNKDLVKLLFNELVMKGG
jgi:hypothetical protein